MLYDTYDSVDLFFLFISPSRSYLLPLWRLVLEEARLVRPGGWPDGAVDAFKGGGFGLIDGLIDWILAGAASGGFGLI